MAVKDEPRWLVLARQQIGVRELPGPANSARIMAWANQVGARILGIAYPGDATPWCGLFMAWLMLECGFKPPAIAIRAKSWASWGVPVGAPYVGAVAVFDRQGGGHVGLIVGSTATHLHILGGNQGDSVSIMSLARNRCAAMRWPPGEIPRMVVATVGNGAGVAVSRNEA